jgi:hypothetical protein
MVAKLRAHPAPAGWCVAGPGSLARTSHARLIAATLRPSVASTVWACGWCGRPPALPEVLSTGGRVSGHAALEACPARFFLPSAGTCATIRPASFGWQGSLRRPAGWCVAGPGTTTRTTRARHIATTTRPTIATTIWACGWCGRPTFLSPLWRSRADVYVSGCCEPAHRHRWHGQCFRYWPLITVGGPRRRL